MKQEQKVEHLYLSHFVDFEKFEKENTNYFKGGMNINENLFEEMNFKANIRDSIYRMNCFFGNWSQCEKENSNKLELSNSEAHVILDNQTATFDQKIKSGETNSLANYVNPSQEFDEDIKPRLPSKAKNNKSKLARKLGIRKRKNSRMNIGQIIELVNNWLRISKDYSKAEFHNLILEAKERAANELGIKKKSLDDLLTKLRLGIALNYDYHNHKKDKFVNLRRFIEKNKMNVKWKSSIHDDIDILVLIK